MRSTLPSILTTVLRLKTQAYSGKVNVSAKTKGKVMNSFILFVTLLITLNGCGFKLRGNYLLAPELQTLYLSSVDKQGELTRLVKQHLKLNRITVINNATQITPELRILKDKLDRRTLSVFPNGQVAEYELIYTVRFQLKLANQDAMNFNFEINRDYQDDPNTALAKSRELTLLLSEMRQQAASKILRDMANIQMPSTTSDASITLSKR
jgi:LPS-assembly lipoprotein